MASKSLILVGLLFAAACDGTDSAPPATGTAPLAAACPGPAKNVLMNSGFDGSLSGWSVGGAPYASYPTYSTMDAGSCNGSGSVTWKAGNASTITTPCFNLTPGDQFTLSAKVIEPAGSLYHAACELAIHTGANCIPLEANDASTDLYVNTVTAPSWQTIQRTITIPAGIKSGYVSCGPSGSWGPGDFFFDQIYLVKNN